MFKPQSALFCLFLLAALPSRGQQVILKGIYKNTPDPVITANIPVDGKQFSGASIRLPLDATTGAFQQVVDIKKPGFLTLTNNWNQVRLFVTPGQTYTIEADSSYYNVSGDQQAGQDLIKTFDFRDDTRIAAANLNKIPAAEARVAAAKEAADKKKAAVETLFREGKISEAFRQALLSSIDINYLSTLSDNFFFTFREKEQQPEAVAQFRKDFLPVWKKIYDEAAPFTQLLIAPGYSWMLERYDSYQEIADSGKLIFQPGIPEIQKIDFFKTTLKGATLEYAWANSIISGIGANLYEKEWIGNFRDFRQQFPHSQLTPYLEKKVQKVIAYYDADKRPNKAVQYLANYDKMNQFKEVAAALKGKVTYIDLWATWCSPCRAELQYSLELHDTLHQLGVQTVYLSIDNDNADKAWKQMAQRLPLKGINLRTNKALHQDINRIVPKFNGIPRYIILDKNGDVAVWDAKRPSDNLELIKQLKQYL
nr:TlpA disulfide reductase family protein [uncultured Chitinophaga sp.]